MIRKIQEEVRDWANTNFGDVPSWQSLLGVQEEVGELSHAYLKRVQGIRGTYEEHTEEIKDAAADILIYLLDFCGREGIDLENELVTTWDKVKQRDWKKNPNNAHKVKESECQV